MRNGPVCLRGKELHTVPARLRERVLQRERERRLG